MAEIEEVVHRTWIQYLIDSNLRELAALALDGEIALRRDDYGTVVDAFIDLPPAAYSFVTASESLIELSKNSLHDVLKERSRNLDVYLRIKLLDVEDNWKEVIRTLILNIKKANQGVITEKIFLREGREPFLYNEMKFASQSEIRIAQELERQKILFFPLPLAVRSDTGVLHRDHREVDFLVCNDGVWGILEVSHHPNRFEQDAEKDTWFKRSGILCVQHYTAERCYNQSSSVVKEFLEILAKLKR